MVSRAGPSRIRHGTGRLASVLATTYEGSTRNPPRRGTRCGLPDRTGDAAASGWPQQTVSSALGLDVPPPAPAAVTLAG